MDFLKNIFFYCENYFLEIFFLLNIFFLIFNLIFLFIKKDKRNKKIIFYSSIKPSKIWISDLIKLSFFADQKNKDLIFSIYKAPKNINCNNTFYLSAPLNYEFLKNIINGIESNFLEVGIDNYGQIFYFKYKKETNFFCDFTEKIEISLCRNSKKFSIFNKDKKAILLPPASAMNVVENFLKN